MEQTFQRQRFELKYRINESKAQEIRFFVENYLECDPNGASNPDRSYKVHSLYLDSPGLNTYHRTVNGDRNRYKLRLRYYDSVDSPVFFEIKQRRNRVIRKKRAQVVRDSVQDLLNGHAPTKNHLAKNSLTELDALEHFCFLTGKLQASPKMHVTYMREAYEKRDSNDVRVTIDRDVKSSRVRHNHFEPQQSGGLPVFGNTVILELKFTNRFPDWLNELTQRFHLRRESASKYVDSIEFIRFSRIEKGMNTTPVYHE
ncbi:polyphosphate polymerase domain-containing protein [Rhodohalobacter sulfatireducens]|uniref:Polyphosphate polymerase domain-containing protein n=1 Tax=Rhodohalobacter sulfatireducens TaxID=2911366 RepID=A0ABS9KIF3_9BACT|nr:polyphosphate polymerase domain-containing protein [Rhodohalobacter sulfatireducens]MCG2590610.1 polyphosphate polymerase domain-containing protein [Rhodohalobacter sulfatireducens]